jgi:cell division protein FtsI (penicillin-binding protein 3)
MGGVLVQAYRIQIIQGPSLRKQAQRARKLNIVLRPTRGTVYDRNMIPLAVTYPVQSIFARPALVKDPDSTAKVLSPILEMQPARVRHALSMRSPFVWLKRQVLPPVGERIMAMELEGIGVVSENRRFYPHLQRASHLLGFVGVDNTGLEGLEYHYDAWLRGQNSQMQMEHDALGRILAPRDGRIPQRLDGYNLVLTIREDIQQILERRLEEGVKRFDARGAMGVVLRPSTGEVLAMASIPQFDPNRFWEFPRSARRNRCVTDPVEPGSTIKPFLVAAALEEGVWKPSDIFFCENGRYRIMDRLIHDVKPHGWLTLKDIVVKSSNIGAAKVGLSLGPDTIYEYLVKFGFRDETGIDLPGESGGIIRPPHQWTTVDVATISFGQGISVTPVQLASAFAALANGGQRMRPFVVREILDKDNALIKRVLPKPMGRAVSAATARAVTKMLSAAVGRGGTGWKAAISGYQVAGKTGTSQKPDLISGGYSKEGFLALFAGFVPAADPKLCILIIVDEPKKIHHGGLVAAPIFRQVASASLAKLGVVSKSLVASLRTGGHAIRREQ